MRYALDDGTVFDFAKAPTVTAVCHHCGAQSGPIPLTESGDPGDKWTGVYIWGVLALETHKAECPGRVPEPVS